MSAAGDADKAIRRAATTYAEIMAKLRIKAEIVVTGEHGQTGRTLLGVLAEGPPWPHLPLSLSLLATTAIAAIVTISHVAVDRVIADSEPDSPFELAAADEIVRFAERLDEINAQLPDMISQFGDLN